MRYLSAQGGVLQNIYLCDHLKKGSETAAPATADVAGYQARHPAPNRHALSLGCLICIKADECMNKD
jgi:hypothetical protein